MSQISIVCKLEKPRFLVSCTISALYKRLFTNFFGKSCFVTFESKIKIFTILYLYM